jgi:hypothetical protein
MPVNRQGDQMIGADLQMLLVPSAAFAAGTYHVGLTPSGTPPFQPTTSGQTSIWSLKTGAPAVQDSIIYSGGKFLQLTVDVTAITASSVTVTIFGFDVASNKFYAILVSTALVVATTVLRVGPGLTTAANLVANDFMPLTWAIQAVVTGGATTFSIGANQMP